MIIGKNNGLNGWEQQNLHIIIKHTQVLEQCLLKQNYGQDPRMGFEGRKKGKYKRAKKFIEKMKEIQEEAKVALGKVQEEMKKYADRKRGEIDDYKVGDLVMLSTVI